MSSIEQQLVRDIAAVTEGVVVTDSDLREARADIDELIVIRHRRNRRRAFAAAAAAAAVLVAGGIAAALSLGDDDGSVRPAGRPTPVVDPDADWLTGAAPTRQLLQGVWRLDNGEITLQFGADGTVRFADNGPLFAQPDATGTYTISGDLIAMTTTRRGVPECVDAGFAMRVSLVEDGRMNFVRSGPADAGCSPVPASFARGTWEQMLPTPPALVGLEPPANFDWAPLTSGANIYGDLLPKNGGYLLEIDRGGAYYVADETGAVVDQGDWTLRHSDLTLTSAEGTACAKGDRLVLAGVENDRPGVNTIRGTVQRDDCNGGWASPNYFIIAHRSLD
jgi:hypothetical protein